MLILVLVAAGSFLEIAGVLNMANHYLRVKNSWQVALVVTSALWRGKFAENAAEWAQLSDDDPLLSLKGLSLILIGFILQFIAAIISIYSHLNA